ncbi:MAG TPA: type II toxin-antitoxin system prevent-host-death family antitoxin [Candidatus Dormibacteraeota bacterium]|nr:type II toxin-antitoxin system prevent-host-death family antitoxin [Candidatus Dormibacteraeota bacterium]
MRSSPCAWQTREARQRFSELVRRAQEDGPQIVTRHGVPRLPRDGPPTDDLEIERDHTPGREVILPDV